MECCCRIKEKNGRLVAVEDEMRRTFKNYMKDLYNTKLSRKLLSTYGALLFREVIALEESRLVGMKWK